MKTFKQARRLIAAFCLFPTVCLAAGPARHERLVHWSASSTTATSITGDVATGPDRLVLDDGLEARAFHLSRIRALDQVELAAASKLLGNPKLQSAILYNIHIPGRMKFVNGNTICGASAVTKVILTEGRFTYGSETGLSLIFFEGSKEPFFDGWENSTGLCGTFNYAKN